MDKRDNTLYAITILGFLITIGTGVFASGMFYGEYQATKNQVYENKKDIAILKDKLDDKLDDILDYIARGSN